jgi:DNA-binding GntR family transcriptional regulator
VSLGDTYRPLREVVAEELRRMILRGELAPGERLTEDRLAEQLGVSRNPVREAIRSLEATGLVEVIPRRGAYVCHSDPDDVRKLLELRGVLEGYAAETAARTQPDGLIDQLTQIIDDGEAASAAGNHVRAAQLHRDFHLAIERSTQNPYLLQVVEPMRQRTEMVFSMLIDTRGGVSWREHEAVRDAIASGDADRSRAMVFEHIMSVLEELDRIPAKRAEAS